MPQLPANKQNDEEDDDDVGENETLEVERVEQGGVTGDEDQEDVGAEYDPGRIWGSPGSEGEAGQLHVLCLHRGSHSHVSVTDKGPRNECGRARDGEKIRKDIACILGNVQQRDQAEQIGDDDGVDGYASGSSFGQERWGPTVHGLRIDCPASEVDGRVDGREKGENDDSVHQISGACPTSLLQCDSPRRGGRFRGRAEKGFRV